MHRNAWKSGKTSERSMEHINVIFQVLTLYYSFLRCFHCGKLGEGYTSLCILLLLCPVTLYLFQNKSFKGKKKSILLIDHLFFCPQICSSFWIFNLGLQSSSPNTQERSLLPSILPPISTKAKFSAEVSPEKKSQKQISFSLVSLQLYRDPTISIPVSLNHWPKSNSPMYYISATEFLIQNTL